MNLNKNLRKWHRWLSLPFVLIIIMMPFVRELPVGATLQKIQQIMMLSLAITGAYLYLVPYITKWQRQHKRKAHAQFPSIATEKTRSK